MDKTIKVVILALMVFQMAFASFSIQRRGGSNKGSIFKLEGDIGYTQVDYSKTDSAQSSLDMRLVQSGLRARGLAGWMVIPEWLWVGASIDKIFSGRSDVKKMPIVSENCCEIKTLDWKGIVGFWFPNSRPLNFSLMVEYFNSKLKANSPSFNKAEISGWHYGAQIDITSHSGHTLYGRWFPAGSNKYWELRGGLQLKFGGKGGRYPYSLLNSGILMNIDYASIQMAFDSPKTLEIDRQEYTVSLGARF